MPVWSQNARTPKTRHDLNEALFAQVFFFFFKFARSIGSWLQRWPPLHYDIQNLETTSV